VSKDELLNCTNQLCSVHMTASDSASVHVDAKHLLQVLYCIQHSLCPASLYFFFELFLLTIYSCQQWGCMDSCLCEILLPVFGHFLSDVGLLFHCLPWLVCLVLMLLVLLLVICNYPFILRPDHCSLHICIFSSTVSVWLCTALRKKNGICGLLLKLLNEHLSCIC